MPSWPRSSRSSGTPTSPDAAGGLVVQLSTGRLRRVRHAVLAVLAAAAGWAWFGASGLVPVIVWWWHAADRPRPGSGPLRIDLTRVRHARLGPWRTCLYGPWPQRLELFDDELSREAHAALRRQLGTLGSARRGPEHVEPV